MLTQSNCSSSSYNFSTSTYIFFFFFASTVYRNFSIGNLVFYKASFICGWWSKSVFSRAAEGWIQVTDHRWDKVYLPIAWCSDGWNSLTSGSLCSGSHNPHKGNFVHGWMQNCCGGSNEGHFTQSHSWHHFPLSLPKRLMFIFNGILICMAQSDSWPGPLSGQKEGEKSLYLYSGFLIGNIYLSFAQRDNLCPLIGMSSILKFHHY